MDQQIALQEAERRERILSDVSQALLEYGGDDEVEPLRRIVQTVSGAFDDWCAFSLVRPGGMLASVAQWHPDARQRELQQKIQALQPPRRWDRPPVEFNALVRREPVVIDAIPDELLRRSVTTQELYDLYKQVNIVSALTAPMFEGALPMGTLTLASTKPGGRRFSAADAHFATALAGRAALAVRNARLVRDLAAERDRQRSERVETERHLAELRAVFDSDPNGIALFDAEGRLQLASHAIEEIFGLPLRAMYGQPFEDTYRRKLEQVVSKDREAMLERVKQIFADRAARSRDELELERPRHRYLVRTSVPVTSASGEYL
ncbi:MAG TPA: GAF domain-containing protein, partial [Myxococcales bacterium]|nr:GAF domain-containing protein [Myxococcales bacterium]